MNSRKEKRMTAACGFSAPRTGVLLVVLLALALNLAGCGKEEAPARQAPPVTIGKPTISSVREYAIFTGFSRAVESALT